MLTPIITPEYWSTMKRMAFLKMTSGPAAVEATATGNPLTFQTDLAKPLKSLLIPFTPQQEGSGDPSPQNIRPIVAWDGVKVEHGANLFPANDNSRTSNGIELVRTHGHVKISGTVINTSEYNIAVTGSWEADGEECVLYGIPKAPEGVSWYVYDGGNRLTGQDINGIPFQTREGRNTTLGISIALGVSINLEFDPVMFKTTEKTETDISFPSPVYGGTLDIISGRMLVEWAMEISTGAQGEAWGLSVSADKQRAARTRNNFAHLPKIGSAVYSNYLKNAETVGIWNGWFARSTGNFLCYIADEIDTVAKWKAYIAENPLAIAYELDEPYEITLTPEQITAIKGNNTIWSDANGSMTAVYLKKKGNE